MTEIRVKGIRINSMQLFLKMRQKNRKIKMRQKSLTLNNYKAQYIWKTGKIY